MSNAAVEIDQANVAAGTTSPAAISAQPTVRTVSAIMPVRNEEACIARTLDALVAQEFPLADFEILVVDGQSTDRTRAIVENYVAHFPNISLHDNPRRWSSAARNIGVRQSHGDVIVVIDGHCEITDRQHLAKLVEAFNRSGADCLGRPQPLDISNATAMQRAIAAARSSPLGHHPDSFTYSDREAFVPAHSVAVAYRREVFDQVGLFDDRFDACEDVELNHRIDRAGLSCFFTPDVAVRYVPRGTLRGLFRQMVRYGRGRIRLLRKHPNTFSLKTLAPFVFVAGLIAGLAGAVFSSAFAAVFICVLAAYVAAVTVASGHIAAQSGGPRLALRVPLVFFAIHSGAGFGQLLELFRIARHPLTQDRVVPGNSTRVSQESVA